MRFVPGTRLRTDRCRTGRGYQPGWALPCCRRTAGGRAGQPGRHREQRPPDGDGDTEQEQDGERHRKARAARGGRAGYRPDRERRAAEVGRSHVRGAERGRVLHEVRRHRGQAGHAGRQRARRRGRWTARVDAGEQDLAAGSGATRGARRALGRADRGRRGLAAGEATTGWGWAAGWSGGRVGGGVGTGRRGRGSLRGRRDHDGAGEAVQRAAGVGVAARRDRDAAGDVIAALRRDRRGAERPAPAGGPDLVRQGVALTKRRAPPAGTVAVAGSGPAAVRVTTTGSAAWAGATGPRAVRPVSAATARTATTASSTAARRGAGRGRRRGTAGTRPWSQTSRSLAPPLAGG